MAFRRAEATILGGPVGARASAARLHLRLAGSAAVGLGLLVLPPVLGVYWQFLLTDILIFALFSLSLNLLMGLAGMISFGHAAYYALGAYGAALLSLHLGVPMPLAFAAGPLVAGLGAAIFGFFCVRLTQVYFIMLTLGFAQLVFAVVFKAYYLTGGENGLAGIRPLPQLSSPLNYYYFTLAVVAACTLLLYRVTHSPFGYCLRAIRDNPQRAQLVGLPVRRYRWYAFVIAGFFGGVAGTLFCFYNGSITPQIAYWTTSAQPFMAVVIGGIGSFWGPVAGAIVYQLLQTQLGRFTENWALVLGLSTLAIALCFQRGLAGYGADLRARLAWWRKQSSS